jgi:hypothetical protein
MVVKNSKVKLKTKPLSKKQLKKDIKAIEEEKEESGMGLDDAFGDDEGVEYAESKPRKQKKGMDEEELEEEIGKAEQASNGNEVRGDVDIKGSKSISKIKKGDKISVDGKQLEVDAHYCLIDHGSTKEMAIELFDSKTDKDYQLRYFDDQVKETLDFYELQEILYVKRPVSKVSW